MEYTDKTLRCAGCGNDFLWTAPEQFFYAGRGLREPKRCGECRARQREAGPAAPRARGARVTCAQCGQETRVPFQPREGRPVYCEACFEARRSKQHGA
jgi:CxxC-x17-CxxC domain-containing protein